MSAGLRRSKERNRAAQRRYRDRQRTRLAEREEQLAALTEKLSLVLSEKVRASTSAAIAHACIMTLLGSPESVAAWRFGTFLL